MIRQRIAHTITVDHREEKDGGGLYVEGVKVPFAVKSDPVVSHIDGYVGTVTVTFYADNVEVVTRGGERRYPVRTGPFEAELEWARREGRRIVLEGMADVIEALYSGAMSALEHWPARYVLGLDENDRKALISGTTHSQSGQSTEREGDTR